MFGFHLLAGDFLPTRPLPNDSSRFVIFAGCGAMTADGEREGSSVT